MLKSDMLHSYLRCIHFPGTLPIQDELFQSMDYMSSHQLFCFSCPGTISLLGHLDPNTLLHFLQEEPLKTTPIRPNMQTLNMYFMYFGSYYTI